MRQSFHEIEETRAGIASVILYGGLYFSMLSLTLLTCVFSCLLSWHITRSFILPFALPRCGSHVYSVFSASYPECERYSHADYSFAVEFPFHDSAQRRGVEAVVSARFFQHGGRYGAVFYTRDYYGSPFFSPFTGEERIFGRYFFSTSRSPTSAMPYPPLLPGPMPLPCPVPIPPP